MLRTLRTVNTVTILYYFGLILLIDSCFLQIFTETSIVPTLLQFLATVVAMGIFSFMDSLCFIRASQIGKASRNTMLLCLTPLYTFLFEIFYLNEDHNPVCYIGALFVAGSAVHLAVSKK